jgi:transposase
MDQTTINWIGIAVIGCAGWFARMIWDRLREIEKNQKDLEIVVARDYVSNGDLSHAIADIKVVMQTVVSPMQQSIEYIRARVDNIPQRRQNDPPTV